MSVLEAAGGPAVTAAAIVSGRETVVSAVEALQPLLVNPQPPERASGVQLLSDTLWQLPSSRLDAQEAAFVAQFFCDRVRDHFTVVPAALSGLEVAVRFTHLAAESLQKLVQSLYKDVHAQSLMLSQRRHVFAALHHVLSARAADVAPLGSDLVLGCVQAVEGEKDPRNLLVVFATVRLLAAAVKLAHLAEDVFEMLACYFPVDFNPPEEAGVGVTRQMLADALEECLGSSPEWAEFCVPLALEKLGSDLTQAKLDSLSLLRRCCGTYTGAQLAPHLTPLRLALVRETLTPRLQAVQTAALALTAAVSAAVPTQVDQWTRPLLTEALHHLSQPAGERLLAPVSALLVALCPGDADAVLSAAVPILLQILETGGEPAAERFHTLEALSWLLVDGGGERSAGVAELRPRAAAVLLATLSESDTALLTSALKALQRAPWLVVESDTAVLAQHLLSHCVANDAAIRAAALSCATAAAGRHPIVVTESLLRPLLDRLVADEGDYSVSERQLEAVAAAVTETVALRTAAPLLLVRLVRVSRVDTGDAVRTLQTLTALVEAPNVAEYLLSELRLPQKVLELFCAAAREVGFTLARPEPETSSSAPLHQVELVRAGGTLLAALTRRLSADDQTRLLSSAVGLYLRGDGEPLLGALVERWQAVQPLLHKSPWQHTQLLALLGYALSAARPTVAPPQHDILTVLLVKLALKKNHPLTTEVAAKTLAVFVNKRVPAESSAWLQTVTDQMLFLFENCSKEGDGARRPVVALWGALCKGLVLRGHPRAREFVNRLLDWLSESEGGEAAADALEDLVREDVLLNVPNYCTVRLLHRQWLFTVSCERLTRGFGDAADPAVRRRHLRALGSQLASLPAAVVSPQLAPLLPLLVAALSEEAGLSATCLQVLSRAVADAPAALQPHVETLVPRLLQTAASAQQLTVRSKALHCLSGITRLKPHAVLPLKPQVLRELAPCLDDKKRLVRQEAAAARNLWFLLGASGGLK